MSASTLRSFFPDAEIQRSPDRLHPYGNSKPLHPIGQVELLCEKHNKFDTLTFQVLPDSCIGIKPALLSGSDSDRLGLISVQTDEIHSLCSSADDNASTKWPPRIPVYSTSWRQHTTEHSVMPKPREP